MNRRFENKKILITGGNSGIGLAGAKRLTEEGATVIITGKNKERLAEAEQFLGSNAIVIEDDLADGQSAERIVPVVEKMGGLDGLWLNAGVASGGELQALDMETITAMFKVNVFAPMLQLAALSSFLKTGSAVLVTSSTAVYEGLAGVSLYSATKGAVLSAARSWASELAPRNIRVNTLVPGPIKSNLRAGLPPEMQKELEDHLAETLLLKRIGEPEEAAALALFLLSDEASFITGSSYLVDGGYLLI
ncbi:SDR family NAD(P)-dependent oxidoreductase [Chryseobacterium camelliae]|uniref:SDR family NAD(P)-dependent oxidoreductase n=1 Tax=Chryseobacterium camelliae TaxID=1265445 RepID=UPI00285FC4B2|nr:SDR family oxidoreductase [Chryseobacterium camelliae]MDR6513847.1 NAD(P)-dependent dehydrogenase (short-subunit alcohol dehydrogenase family) [Chryseobacterium camelliae]